MSDKEREAFFRKLIDHSPEPMLVLDADEVVQFINPAGRNTLLGLFPDPDKAPIRIDRYDGYSVLQNPAKNHLDGICCYTAEIDWQGEKYTLAIIQDGFAKAGTEAQVFNPQQHEAQFQQFFEHANNGFVLAKIVRDEGGEPTDFVFAQVNRAFEKALPLRREVIQGKSARLFLPNIEKMAIWQALKDVAESGTAVQVQTYSDVFDKHFNLSIYAPVDGFLAVIFTDITQQVVAEDELRQNERKFRSLFGAMAMGVVIQDQAGEIISANPAAERILGLAHDNLLGKGSLNYDWQTVKLSGEPLPGESHPAMIALRTGRRVDDFILGLYNPMKNSRKWLSVSAVPEFREGEEQAYQVITTFVEITDRIRVQRAFEERVHELRCLTEIGSMLQKNPPLSQVCSHTVQALVLAMQHSDLIIAEVQLAGEVSSSNPNGAPGGNTLVVPIKTSGEKIGQIKVSQPEGLTFILPEEKNLLESVADSLAMWYERSVIQSALRSVRRASGKQS